LTFLIQEKVVVPGKTTVLGEGSISGVDTKRFRPNPRKRESIRTKFDISSDTLLVIFLGRLHLDKGLLDLAEAVAAADPGHKIELMCVGPDEGKMSARVRAVVEESGRRVHLVGATDSPEDYLAACDLLCLPSYREGFGTSVIEAAAVGVPAIVSDIYGLSDSVIDGNTGLCFPVKDVDALTAALNKMASSPVLRKKLGDEARARAIVKFSSKFLTSELLRYVEAQLNQHASHNPSRGAN
jgi:glycosyltransferase involved in cell wall biosynthesis